MLDFVHTREILIFHGSRGLLYFYLNVSTIKSFFSYIELKRIFHRFLKNYAIFLSDFDTTVTLVSNGMAIYPWTNSIRLGDQSWCNSHREIICIVLSLKIIYYDGCNPFYNVRLIFVKEKKKKRINYFSMQFPCQFPLLRKYRKNV